MQRSGSASGASGNSRHNELSARQRAVLGPWLLRMLQALQHRIFFY